MLQYKGSNYLLVKPFLLVYISINLYFLNLFSELSRFYKNISRERRYSSPSSVEQERIFIVVDVHEPKSRKPSTSQVSESSPSENLQKEKSPKLEALSPKPLMRFSPVGTELVSDNSPLHTDYTNSSVNTADKCKRKFQKEKDKGNLLETYKSLVADEIRKYNVNRGLKYKSRSGKIKPERKMKSPCPITCKKKCRLHFIESERKKIFDLFWKIGNHTRQWDFISKHAKRETTKRVTKCGSKRTYTVKYFFPLNTENSDEITLKPVCKLMFLNTLGISYNFLNTALNKFDQGDGTIEPDCRGKHSYHSKAITPDIKKSVCDHFKSFVHIDSPYTKTQSNKIYLDSTITYRKMFDLYTEWLDITKHTEKPINVRQYRDIIQKKFNISFHKPKKVKSDSCPNYKNVINPSAEQKSEQVYISKRKARCKRLK